MCLAFMDLSCISSIDGSPAICMAFMNHPLYIQHLWSSSWAPSLALLLKREKRSFISLETAVHLERGRWLRDKVEVSPAD